MRAVESCRGRNSLWREECGGVRRLRKAVFALWPRASLRDNHSEGARALKRVRAADGGRRRAVFAVDTVSCMHVRLHRLPMPKTAIILVRWALGPCECTNSSSTASHLSRDPRMHPVSTLIHTCLPNLRWLRASTPAPAWFLKTAHCVVH